MMVSMLLFVCLSVTIFHLSAVSAQTFTFRRNATGPDIICEGSNVTLQCVIIQTNPDNKTSVPNTIWNKNGMPVQMANGSFIPNHSIEFNYTTGGFTDLVITDVRLGDNNTMYSCSAVSSTISSSVVLNVIQIPVIENLEALDQCNFITATWNVTKGSCKDLLYNVTLLHSGHTISKITNDTTYRFPNTSTFNGKCKVRVFAVNGNAHGIIDSGIAVNHVPYTDLSSVTDIRNTSRICVTSFNISWNFSGIECGDISYMVSISQPLMEGDAVTTNTTDRFFSVMGLNNSQHNVTITVTASTSRAGQGAAMNFTKILHTPQDPPPVENAMVCNSTTPSDLSKFDIIISWSRPVIMDKCATLPITGYVIKANVTPENGSEAFDITSKFINDTRSDKGNFIVSFKDSFNEHLKPNAHYNFTVNGTDVKVSSTCPRIPAMVPGITVSDNTIILNGNNFSLTLSWREPFSVDPIVYYTVSCSGDDRCPPTFNRTENFVLITGLTPSTIYTFSVVATNSIGSSGDAGVMMITTPPAIDQVTGVTLRCEPVDQINQCNVMWNPVTQGDITGYQVYYNGTMMNVTMMNVTSSTTTLIFTAPSLPDGVFTGTVVVMVIAVNRYGMGPANESTTAVINASSVTKVRLSEFSIPDNTSEPYNVTFICIIHPDSTATQCELMARVRVNRRATSIGNALRTDETHVTVTGLVCGVEYTIVAGGTLNGDLVGPRRFVARISTTSTCQRFRIHYDVGDDDGDNVSDGGGGDDNEGCGGACIAGIVVGVCAGVSIGIIALTVIVCIRHKKKGPKVTHHEKGDNKQKTDKKSKDKDTIRQPLQEKANSPEAKIMDVYAEVSKDEGDSAKANQMGQLTYADLDIQRGPNRYGDDCHAVEYGQVAETKQ